MHSYAINMSSFNMSSLFHHYIHSPVTTSILNYIFVFFIIFLVVYIFVVASSSSGIHHVNLKRQCIQMRSSYNPFSFEANYTTASHSGITCVLKSEKDCFVQALWGVPIYTLLDLLQGDWQVLKNAVTSHVPSDQFSRKCMSANEPFVLNAGEERSIEFKPVQSRRSIEYLIQPSIMREQYPFVVLMVLKNRNEIQGPIAVAMANAVHIPDRHLHLYPHLIGQFIKLASGYVGQIKKIFLSSPATTEENGVTYDLCVACYHRPVSMVFLPCRHACVCSVCFDLCDRCPVCRASSMQFFELPEYRREDD